MAPAKPSIKDILASAEQAEKTGDPGRAGSIYESILVNFPKHTKAKKALARLRKAAPSGGGGKITQADANNLIGALNAGAFEQVIEGVNALLVHNRKEPFLYNIQGLALGQLGKPKAAITSFKHAVKLNPNFVESLNNLGLLLVQQKRPEEALVQLGKAITKRPQYHEAHNNMGSALTLLNRSEQAMASFNTAIALKPDYANAFYSRGILHKQMQNPALAAADFETALGFTPNDAEIHESLSYVLVDMRQPELALSSIKEAVRLDPNKTESRLRYGIQLNEQGLDDAAVEQLEKLLEIEPGHAEAWRILTGIGKAGPDTSYIAKMELLFNAETTDDAAKVHLGFALGKVLEDVGEYKRAFSYLMAANDLNFARLTYSRAEEDARFDRLKQAYSVTAIAQASGSGDPSDVPILIVGMMRSGTSLVEQILASHSAVYGAGELMAATITAKSLGISEAMPKPGLRTEFAQTYLAELTRNSADSQRVTDKMPGNFAHIGLMRLAFPNIKIVNMVRDPRDNCYSIYKNYFDTGAHQYAYNLEDLANFANQYKSLMRHWHSVFPGQVYDCNYEALTANQEEESRKLLDYCGLEWQPQILDFHKTERSVRTASVNQVRQKIYKSSVRSWERVADDLRPLIDGLDQDLWSDYLG
ncbi:MAG: tetratricopeptide repeat protein [Rhodobacteraceae bacterium]|nr:tetratricopeptide repeat protein [Paracoccaceae bacterium]